MEANTNNLRHPELLKIPLAQLIIENDESIYTEYLHPCFVRKVPKGVILSDYSISEKLIELEYTNGNRRWFDLSLFFGKVIAEVKDLFILHPCGHLDPLEIIGVKTYKIKRTEYMNLIFKRSLPF